MSGKDRESAIIQEGFTFDQDGNVQIVQVTPKVSGKGKKPSLISMKKTPSRRRHAEGVFEDPKQQTPMDRDLREAEQSEEADRRTVALGGILDLAGEMGIYRRRRRGDSED